MDFAVRERRAHGLGIEAGRHPEPDEMAGPPWVLLDPEVSLPCPVDELFREGSAVFRDPVRRPFEDQPERGAHHRDQYEVAPLAHVVTAAPGW